MAKNYTLQVRLNEFEHGALFRAAASHAMELSTWVRWVAIKAASETLTEPIEKLVPRRPPVHTSRRKNR